MASKKRKAMGADVFRDEVMGFVTPDRMDEADAAVAFLAAHLRTAEAQAHLLQLLEVVMYSAQESGF